jgi:signal transduction histidine kinase
VTLSEAGDVLCITIDDDGPGIAVPDMERVFEPFVRLEASRSRETGGVGLGLTIARSIVRGHGGDITLTNRPEGGLRVAVRMPTLLAQ